LYEQTIALAKNELGPNDPVRSLAMHALGVIYAQSGQQAKAIPLLEAVVNPGPKTILPLAFAYSQAGQVEKAERLLEVCVTKLHRQRRADGSDLSSASPTEAAPPVLTSVTTADNSDLPNVLVLLATFQLAQKKYVEAEPVLRECLAIRTELTPDAWFTFNTQS
jgi:tetratricopeptide (TPR) repeat protein